MNGGPVELSHAQERYLRTVYELSQTRPQVLQADVARALGRSKPSVCRAVALLRRRGLLEPDGRGLVLTAEARELEQRFHCAREQMRAALERLGVSADAAGAGMEELVRVLGGEMEES